VRLGLLRDFGFIGLRRRAGGFGGLGFGIGLPDAGFVRGVTFVGLRRRFMDRGARRGDL